MLNYISADLKRIFKKPSFLIVFGGFVLLLFLQTYIHMGTGYTAGAYVEDCMQLAGFFPLIVGISIFLSIYGDDLKAKSMQVAIGRGMSRNGVVITKLIEVMLLTAITSLVVAIVMNLIPMALGMGVTGKTTSLIFVVMLTEGLRIIGYMCLALPVIYYAQNAIPGLIIYVLLGSKIIWIISQNVLSKDIFTKIFGDTTRFILTNAVYSLRGIVTGADFGVISFVVTVAYVVIPLIISLTVFRNRELEF
ncbi:TPA: hypothetical protein TUT10_001874 [Streptococcus equi subsp. zooepidemicus]|nr:hypothetical protein [Streptococcus equi subsp. zooepidemicus]